MCSFDYKLYKYIYCQWFSHTVYDDPNPFMGAHATSGKRLFEWHKYEMLPKASMQLQLNKTMKAFLCTFYTYSIFYTHTYRKDICAINKPIASVYSQFQTKLYILFNFHFELNRSCQIIVVIISYIGAFPLLNFVSFCFVCIASRMAVHCLHKIVRISNSIYDIPHTTHTLLVYTIHRTAYIHNYNISFSIFAAFKQNIQ